MAKEDYYGGTARYVLNLPTCDPIFFQTIDHPMVYHWSSTFMGHRIILGRLSTRIVRLEDPVQHLYGDILQPLIKKSAEFPVMMNTVWMLHDFPPEIVPPELCQASIEAAMLRYQKEWKLKRPDSGCTNGERAD